jgi:hypothetical protein
VWIWIWVAIIVVSLAVQFVLGRRIWRAVRELMAAIETLGTTTAILELELSNVGTRPVQAVAAPRHGMKLAAQA